MARYKVICLACGHWESLPDATRSGNCRSCGHDGRTTETLWPPEPAPELEPPIT